jgi:hypothetical protein
MVHCGAQERGGSERARTGAARGAPVEDVGHDKVEVEVNAS